MKIFICLFALICGSNATLLKLLAAGAAGTSAAGSSINVGGASSGSGYRGGQGATYVGYSGGGGYSSGYRPNNGGSVVYAQNYGYPQAARSAGAPQVYKIILDHGQGYSNSGSQILSEPIGAGPVIASSGAGTEGQGQIFKVITENVAPSTGSTILLQGYSRGPQAYGYSRGNNYDLISRILRAVLEGDAANRFGTAGNNGVFYRQLNVQSDQGGRVLLSPNIAVLGNYLNTGRVVERGTLQQAQVQNLAGGSPSPPRGHPPTYVQQQQSAW